LTRVCSIFSQMLQLIPRVEFESVVRKYQAERHARGFSSWGQFVAMLFCQLGQAKSLREICGGLVASEGKLRHLGVPTAPQVDRPWPMPTNTAPGECTKRCSTSCWRSVMPWPSAAAASRGGFGSKANCSARTRR
jgi:Domain of unknown function (DUF4372)